MEMKYKRDCNRNYMVIQAENEENYQLKMMCNNKIKGLLESHINTFNGNCDIFYDISSKQPLDRLYGTREMCYEDVSGVLFSLKILMEELQKYLLDSSNILFQPEFCYCNPENKRVECALYPQENQGEGLKELAEFMIDRVNHSDSRAVELSYGFYKMEKRESFNRKEMEDLLQKDVPQEKEECNITKEKEDYIMPKGDISYPINNLYSIGNKQEKMTLIEKIKRFLFNKSEEKFGGMSRIGSERMRLHTVSDWEMYGMEDNGAYNGETVVMGMRDGNTPRRLRSLKKGNEEFIFLDKLPCILGKMEECADIVLKDISVSRMHARIYEENGDIYLQDLNSKNGSYINNLELETNETVKLKLGDEVGFGNLRYIYE